MRNTVNKKIPRPQPQKKFGNIGKINQVTVSVDPARPPFPLHILEMDDRAPDNIAVRIIQVYVNPGCVERRENQTLQAVISAQN